MSKSSKKRRQAAKRLRELEELRGVSLLDSASPGPAKSAPLESSPNPENAGHLKNYGKNHLNGGGETNKTKTTSETTAKPVVAMPPGIGSEGVSRKRVEFVLPRSLGKAESYIFDKEARVQINEELPSIREEDEAADEDRANKSKAKANETIDDILFASKKRKLEEKFDTVHQEENKKTKEKSDAENSSATKKKRKSKSRAIDGDEEISKALQASDDTKTDRHGAGETAGSAAMDKKKRKDGVAVTKDHLNGVHPSNKSNMVSVKRKSDASNGEKAKPKLDLVHQGQLSGLSVEEAVKDKHGLRPRANSTDGELNLPQRGLCDERMVLQTHRWDDELNYVHQVTPRGFVNLGNTCFLNSILQCLAYLPPFCQSLVAISEAKTRQKNGMNKKLSKGQRVTSLLCSLFQRVHGVNGGSTREGAITPQAIVKALPSLGTCGSRNGYKFRPGRQEDAHEFLVHLLDAMHDGELRGAGIDQHASGWRDRLPVTRLDETTFVHRIFGGYFRSQVRCRKCGYLSNTYDPFLDLSLEVSKKSSNSVLFALSEFTRKETLDSDNQWKCSGCKKYVCATKHLTVFRPPLSLCIQLKRFTFDGGYGGRGFSSYGTGGGKYGKSNAAFRGGSKITKPIEFPASLNLPLSDGRSCAYNLTGIVIHVGGSASSGHYTAYVKKPGRKGVNQWYHADDSFVEPVSEKTVLRQKDAYVLFYCRKEVKLEFPSPPPRGMSAEEAKEFGRSRAKARADSITQQEEARQTHAPRAESTSTPLEPIYETAQNSEAPTVQEGAVKRVKTKVHPLASPPLCTTQLREEQNSKSASLPDGSVVTFTSLPEYLNKTLSDQAKKMSNPGDLMHIPHNHAEKPNEASSSASNTDASSDSDTGDPEPAKNMEDGNDPSSASSGSDSVRSKGENKVDNKDKTQQQSTSDSSDSESSSDSSQSVEDKTGKYAVKQSKVSSAEHIKQSPIKKDSESQKLAACAEGSDGDSESSSDRASSGGVDSIKDDGSQANSREDKKSKARSSPVTPVDTGASLTNAAQANERKESHRTRVVLGGADSRGKVKVMLGPRKKRSWKTKLTMSGKKGAGFDLLGNMDVSTWDDPVDGASGDPKNQRKSSGGEKASKARIHIVGSMEKQERSRKRKMHLDRWDALLDQGKVSKRAMVSAYCIACAYCVSNRALSILGIRQRRQR
jgi:ubiquitin C-terminal hydrolase